MFKKVDWKWFHVGRFLFISFMRIDKRNYKEKKTNMKKDFEDERNDKEEIYIVCFVCESIR